ncbi:hypothetical protein LJC20_01195 [Eubacteriales bacterium OttesenSCG-928-M02]|nr:hypothetical protein [Eubacteriales bacterium OttesenSCG-928-M02]
MIEWVSPDFAAQASFERIWAASPLTVDRSGRPEGRRAPVAGSIWKTEEEEI